MCDTILAPPGSAAGGSMLYGKNSDRQRNEAQAVELHPGGTHRDGEQIRCTYISIPQARQTYSVLLCRPFWMWGAEMGANEHGVVIGNQAVHARAPAQEEEALLGDDLVRLGLERASSAQEAVEIITRLLGQFGQGGNNGHLTRSYFNNAFMIADASQAFVLETLGREWLIEHVRGVRAMSNRYSIATAQTVSPGLAALIRDSGWNTDESVSYAERIANPNREHIGYASARRQCSTALLNLHDKKMTSLQMMRILRDHGSGEGHVLGWREECAVRRTVCMHAGAEDSPGQTTGSMVSEVTGSYAIHWVTGTAAPCTSIFKPVLLNAPLPASASLNPTDRFDAAKLWWRHEQLHRAALMSDFDGFLCKIADERDALEAQFDERIKSVLNGGDQADRARVVAECWRQANDAETRWSSYIDLQASSKPGDYVAGWSRLNQLAGLELGRSGAAR
jgi:dipeptidase